MVRADDPAALNAHLVGAGVVVTELVAERRTLEQVVLARTGAGADRFGHVGPGVLDSVTRPLRPGPPARRRTARGPGGGGAGGAPPPAASGRAGPPERPDDPSGRVRR